MPKRCNPTSAAAAQIDQSSTSSVAGYRLHNAHSLSCPDHGSPPTPMGAPVDSGAAAAAVQLFACIDQVYHCLKKQKRDCSQATLALCTPPVLFVSWPLLLAAAPHVLSLVAPASTLATARADLYDPVPCTAAPPQPVLRIVTGIQRPHVCPL